METELWPNTLHMAKEAGLSVVVLNTRLSNKAASKYKKIQSIFNSISQNIDHISCQFAEDAKRFVELGMAKEKLSVNGSVKFDLPLFDTTQKSATNLKEQVLDRPVWIAASTHLGEDEILLNAHGMVLEKYENALLILVPRHPERFNSVANIIKEQNFTLTRRSEHLHVSRETSVYLADTMGEMMTMFFASDVAFMAGSLLGEKVGGHNLLEPASLGKPLLTGPSYFNFQMIADELIEAKACYVCQTPTEIANTITMLFTDKTLNEKAGEAAFEVVQKNRGAVAKTMTMLEQLKFNSR